MQHIIKVPANYYVIDCYIYPIRWRYCVQGWLLSCQRLAAGVNGVVCFYYTSVERSGVHSDLYGIQFSGEFSYNLFNRVIL